ncbi:MAG: glycosyl hydrolase family 88 [Gemmatimonadetes bacterium]|nr:glycosyl hydrolase family 88 [Gemmatimonadota bacterium]
MKIAILLTLAMALEPSQAQSAFTAATENTGPALLPSERIAALPAADRAAWQAYVLASTRLHAADSTAMLSELGAEGRKDMIKAPYKAADFRLADNGDDWFRSDSARLAGEGVLSFQTPSGGWSKRTDMSERRARGMSYYAETESWHYIPTFDNGATTGQIRFLSRLALFRPDPRYAAAVHRGLSLIFTAQQPNGCWPQSFPLEGGYHDAVTFNDDATILILATLDDVAAGKVSIASPDERDKAARSAKRGVACLVNAQVVVNGKRTVWGQQYDPITLAVVRARSYELPGLAGRESASIMTYLMSLPTRDTRVVYAIYSAADWFRGHAMTGVRYDAANGFRTDSSNRSLLWARLTDIETGKPIFANRDGIKLFDWDKLTDRRTGYAWFGTEPAAALKRFDEWSQSHPRPGAAPSAEGKKKWSVRLAESVMRRDSLAHRNWDYVAGVVLLAMHRVAERTGDAGIARYVEFNIDRLVGRDGTIATYKLDEFNLDQITEGRLLFPLYASTHDERYAKAARTLREQLKQQPRTSEGGFWHKQIYPRQMWLDGLYMAEPFYAQFARDFNEPAAYDDIARQFLLVARHTRDARTGLMYHAWDESHTQPWADSLTGLSQNFWARAMGWYAMALVDVLDFIPTNHKDRPELIRVLRDVARAARNVQDPVSGLWYDILDQPNRAGNYHEASASSMFVYAFAKGARKGYLTADYRDAATRGFDGIIRELVTVDARGMVSLNGIVSVSGLGGAQKRSGTYAYYMSEPVVSNDHKGVGPLIMAAEELGR